MYDTEHGATVAARVDAAACNIQYFVRAAAANARLLPNASPAYARQFVARFCKGSQWPAVMAARLDAAARVLQRAARASALRSDGAAQAPLYFTAIDFLSGFLQVELTDESKSSTAFLMVTETCDEDTVSVTPAIEAPVPFAMPRF